MGNFVTGNTPLPSPKIDATPPQGNPAELDAADINNLWTAADDLRKHTIGFVNVKEYGAIGDGAADDTAAVQNAINALPVRGLNLLGFSNGGRVFFPPGRYKVTSTINLHRGVVLEGASREATQIVSFTAGSVFKYADAGGFMQDEIGFENLSIWQDASVTATSGAAIEIGPGSYATPSVSFRGSNLIIYGTYRGLMLNGLVASSLRDSLVSATVTHGIHVWHAVAWVASGAYFLGERATNGGNVYEVTTSGVAAGTGGPTGTGTGIIDGSVVWAFVDTSANVKSTQSTSFTIYNSYASQTGGDGFRFEAAAYTSVVGGASDSNARYAYAFNGGTGASVVGSGTEGNLGSSAILLRQVSSGFFQVRVVTLTGLHHAFALDNSAGVTVAGSIFSSDPATTGYAFHIVTPGTGLTVLGCLYTGGHLTNKIDNNGSSLFLGGQSTNAQGGDTPNFVFGGASSSDPTSIVNITGATAAAVTAGIRITPTFTAAGTTNIAVDTTATSANTAVTYPLVFDAHYGAVVKGAASTITRAVGAVFDDQTVGANANAAVSIGTASPAVGNWALVSASANDSYLTAPLRLGGSAGPRFSVGTVAPTTGTWTLGSVVKNSSPAVGSPKGWVCTVAGTPGTWVSEGNL